MLKQSSTAFCLTLHSSEQTVKSQWDNPAIATDSCSIDQLYSPLVKHGNTSVALLP